jgi:hypothetical protein
MIAKQTQGPALVTYGRVTLNPLAAKVGGLDDGKGVPAPQPPLHA